MWLWTVIVGGSVGGAVLAGWLGLRRLRGRLFVVTVEGASMEPSLRAGDRVMARRVPVSALSRGQVVVLEKPVRRGESPVGLAGDEAGLGEVLPGRGRVVAGEGSAARVGAGPGEGSAARGRVIAGEELAARGRGGLGGVAGGTGVGARWAWDDGRRGRIEDDWWIIKRVVALGGDPVPAEVVGTVAVSPDGRVPVGSIVVLGDNREVSIDSRELGFIPGERVLGVVVRDLSTDAGPRSGALRSGEVA